MPFQDEEFLLLSRGGRVPHALSKRPSPDRHVLSKDRPHRKRERVPEHERIHRPRVQRKSLVDSVLVAVAMTRWLVINAREQRRNRS
jgi:hypothetical protein